MRIVVCVQYHTSVPLKRVEHRWCHRPSGYVAGVTQGYRRLGVGRLAPSRALMTTHWSIRRRLTWRWRRTSGCRTPTWPTHPSPSSPRSGPSAHPRTGTTSRAAPGHGRPRSISGDLGAASRRTIVSFDAAIFLKSGLIASRASRPGIVFARSTTYVSSRYCRAVLRIWRVFPSACRLMQWRR